MTSPADDSPVAAAARGAAAQLTPQHGPGLAADVEAALATQDTSQRPGQYFDPVALGSLIVSIASLAWTVYSSQRKQSPAAIAREVRIQLRQQPATPYDTDQITDIVVTELLSAAPDQPADPTLGQ